MTASVSTPVRTVALGSVARPAKAPLACWKRVEPAAGRDPTRPTTDGAEITISQVGEDFEVAVYAWATDGHRLHRATWGDVSGVVHRREALETWGVGFRARSDELGAVRDALRRVADVGRLGSGPGAIHAQTYTRTEGPELREGLDGQGRPCAPPPDVVRCVSIADRHVVHRFFETVPPDAGYGAVSPAGAIPQCAPGHPDADFMVDRAEAIEAFSGVAGNVRVYTTTNALGVVERDAHQATPECATWLTGAELSGALAKPQTWGFHGRYVVDALKAAFGKRVRLCLSGPLDPMVILAERGAGRELETFTAVVMPTRI